VGIDGAFLQEEVVYTAALRSKQEDVWDYRSIEEGVRISAQFAPQREDFTRDSMSFGKLGSRKQRFLSSDQLRP
jgi:hypothetical protein